MIIIVIGFSVLSGINEFSTHKKNLWEGEGIGGGGKEGDFFLLLLRFFLLLFFLFNKNFPSMNM